MSENRFADRDVRSPSVFDLDESEESEHGDSSRRSRSAAWQDDISVHELSEFGDEEHNDPQPTHVPYAVEWKLTANNRMITKDSDQNIIASPEVFWKTRLRPKLRDVLNRKLPSTKTFEAVDTDVVVSVTDRAQRDLVKRFDELDVNWSMLETQLQAWSHLTQVGKCLRIDLSFNYMQTRQTRQTRLSGDTRAQRNNKRGRSSVSDQMLSDRDLQLSAEQSSTGLPLVWPDVYNLMRCTGPPCRAGPYCWRDSATSRHYRLKTHHLKTLVEHVEQGGLLQGHDDVPDSLRHQLYTEEQHQRERQRRRTMPSIASEPTDPSVDLVSQSAQTYVVSPSASTTAATVLSSIPNRLEIPGLRDDAIREYSEWQCSQVRGEDLKMDFRMACELALKDGLDLELIHKDPDTGVFI
ncbi:hypothetical protein LZ31DRAFT_286242 [Colletotrichum somersetense]|nr:hypothetical protein LZ31DRAFT_286242 [Colletotrichum somersetense]